MKDGKKLKTNISGNQEIFTAPEAAEYLKISERMLRDLLKDPSHPLPYYRIGSAGRLIRIRKADIDDWLESYKSKSEINIDQLVADLMK